MNENLFEPRYCTGTFALASLYEQQFCLRVLRNSTLDAAAEINTTQALSF